MPHYLVRASYTAETWSQLIKTPQDREGVVRQLAESIGGKLIAFYYAFGPDDAFVIAEVPDDTAMAALAMAITASGAFRSFVSTRLMTSREAMEAMSRAGTIRYRPPGG